MDKTKNEETPKNEGIYYIDLNTGLGELIVTYKQLSDLLPISKKKQCYINHTSISPDGSKAIFFYIWNIEESPGWKATLWVLDIKTKEIKCLEYKDQVSHYAWKDNENILITGYSNTDKKAFYRVYNYKENRYTDINNKYLNQDGHPSFSRKFTGFYSDTYPDSKFKQLFFKYENDRIIPIIKLFHDPRMYGEKRCDLHPHYFRNSEIVSLDTTFKNNKRHIFIVKLV